jgi:leucyl-tRNA synthetase
VDPEDLINRYGADTVRLFCLFAAPPERDLEWTSEGVEGAYRFLGRVWSLVYQYKHLKAPKNRPEESEQAKSIRRLTHKTIKKVTDDIKNRFHFNTAVAAVMEMTNELARVAPEGADRLPEVQAALYEAVRTVVVLLSPFVPHIAEELWEVLGGESGMIRVPWPSFDPTLLEQDQVLIVVQVNGKKRGEITVPSDASDDEIKEAAMAEGNVSKFIAGKPIRKSILVPGKLLNLVV